MPASLVVAAIYFIWPKAKVSKRRDTVSFGPKARHAGLSKRCILDLEQRLSLNMTSAPANSCDLVGVPHHQKAQLS